jgi:hypothetical protein
MEGTDPCAWSVSEGGPPSEWVGWTARTFGFKALATMMLEVQ